ncbi:MFS transporter [Sphingobium sp. AN641]|uniref:MFS transporter n=1 Tax=Sphingobium sp. AN641 TaxID=3133443 RepID=UPI0030C1BB97
MNNAASHAAPFAVAAPAESEFRRGWRILLPSILGCAFCMGTLATISIGPFVTSLGQDMGWSRTQVQMSLLFGQGFSSLGVIATGVLLEKFGARRVALGGLLATALGLALTSLAQSIAHFYAIMALTALFGAGAGAITWSHAVTRAFDRNRGLALAIVLSGAGLAGVFLPSFLAWVIGGHGWRAGYLALACLPALIAVPAVYIMFHPHERIGRQVAPASRAASSAPAAMRGIFARYRFWALLISIFCTYFAISGVMPNFIPALTDKGFSLERAAMAQGAFGASLIVGRLAVGLLVDRFWAPAVGAMFLAPPALGCLLLTWQPGFAAAIVAAALIGLATGAELDLLALLTSRYFEPPLFSRVYSWIYAAAASAGAVSPMLFSWMQDLTGSYTVSFYVTAVLFLVGGALLLTMGRYLATEPAGGNDRSRQ